MSNAPTSDGDPQPAPEAAPGVEQGSAGLDEQTLYGPRPGDEALDFDIPSVLARGREVQNAILDACERHGFGEDAYFAVKLALDEAVTNAIKHGNQFADDKRVRVKAGVNPERCWVEVRDEGPGFKRDTIPDPRQDENLHKCSGRGLLLIEAYMSDVDWSEDGKAIRMSKLNRSEPPAVPSE